MNKNVGKKIFCFNTVYEHILGRLKKLGLKKNNYEISNLMILLNTSIYKNRGIPLFSEKLDLLEDKTLFNYDCYYFGAIFKKLRLDPNLTIVNEYAPTEINYDPICELVNESLDELFEKNSLEIELEINRLAKELTRKTVVNNLSIRDKELFLYCGFSTI